MSDVFNPNDLREEDWHAHPPASEPVTDVQGELMDQWSEVSQIQVALSALQTQPYDARIRMLEWLWQRIQADEAKAIQKRRDDALARVQAGA